MSLEISHYFSQSDVHPFDAIKWKRADARLYRKDGSVRFEALDIEVPEFWTQQTIDIVAEKYFRVINGVRETSAKQMFGRVAHTIAQEGVKQGLFELIAHAKIFELELLHLLVNQMFAFNSPVWFNIGVPGVRQQASACFIQNVEDDMESILKLQSTESRLFKGGSGTGSNLSKLRSSIEKLSNGGTASGPVSFMRGYDAWAGVIKSGGGTRRAAKMVILNDWHADILEFIRCKAEAEKMAHALIDAGYPVDFNDPNSAYNLVPFQNANNSVRVSDAFMSAVEHDLEWTTHKVTNKEVAHTYKARYLFDEVGSAAWLCGDPGLQFDDIINRWHTCKGSGRINASNPCSEYMFLDDTACNLGSWNLMKFLNEDGSFDITSFAEANRIAITAMHILVGHSEYPSEEIARNSHLFRPLGIGYANLGTLLMAMGYPYDSDEGRGVAASITSLMSATCYGQSALIAKAVGAFPQYKVNDIHMLNVISMHSAANEEIKCPAKHQALKTIAGYTWSETYGLGKNFGFANSQISVLAPVGTIGFLMGVDTTGIEPMTFLLAVKKLIGGGEIKMLNGAVFKAMKALQYSDDVIKSVQTAIENGQEWREYLEEDDLKIFQVAVGPKDQAISVEGHIDMMAAVQPFLSGAISKTVNMPSDSTVEDVKNAYLRAWKKGLKAIAIYRDGSKRSQPLSDANEKKGKEMKQIYEGTGNFKEEDFLEWGKRKRLPPTRPAEIHKFSVGGQEAYLHMGYYADGSLAETFLTIAKEGSGLSGFANMWMTAMSIGLQHGAPLSTFIDKFRGMKFDPSGFTDNPEIRQAQSLGDYVARFLESKFFNEAEPHMIAYRVPTNPPAPSGIDKTLWDLLNNGPERYHQAAQEQAGKMTTEKSKDGNTFTVTFDRSVKTGHEKATGVGKIASISYDGPPCNDCGNLTQRAGSCYKCNSCGSTTGCG